MTVSEQQAVTLLFETTKVMIPVVTGFIGLYLGALGAFWKAGCAQALRRNRTLVILPVFLGVVSLGVWSGTLPFMIRATAYQKVQLFHYGQYCAQAGHVLFFLGVAAAAVSILVLLRTHEQREE